ncbi:MAG TPA: hypothetical protein VF365_04140 [Candidatus Limnocylindria bacterium]
MSDRRALLARLAPAVLIALLAAAWMLPETGAIRLASADRSAADEWAGALASLPEDATVLVGFDPDLGTYPEVRATVRVALADLLNRDARLAFVSLTPEGRALLVSELGRLRRGEANAARLLDLGYLPGAEAALVSIARRPGVPTAADGELARRVAAGGIDAVDAILVVGGNDLGPRSWVEQVRPRVGDLPILAIAPTVLLPELQPYLESGQLAALLGTPRDGAAYRDATELGPLERLREAPEPAATAVLIGLLLAVLILGEAWGRRLLSQLREAGRLGRDAA